MYPLMILVTLLGVASHIIVGDMETAFIASEIKSESHIRKLNDHIEGLNTEFNKGHLNSIKNDETNHFKSYQ